MSSPHPPSAAGPHGLISPAAKRTTYPQAARALLHSTLFDAARHELARRRWNEVTMADIAATAGVSRPRIYKEFGSRDEFARALVVHEGDRFVAAVDGAIDTHLDDPHAALLAAFELFLTVAAEDPLLRAAITGDDEMLPLVTTEGQPLLASSTQRLQGAMVSRWPQLGTRDAALLAECLVRLAISYATLPAGPAGVTAASIADLLGPCDRPDPPDRDIGSRQHLSQLLPILAHRQGRSLCVAARSGASSATFGHPVGHTPTALKRCGARRAWPLAGEV